MLSNLPVHKTDVANPPRVTNMTATASLCVRIDLKSLALHAGNTQYNPKRFSALIMRIREPKTTALIFCSGKIVITGATSPEDAKLAAMKFARIVQKTGYKVKFEEFKVVNMVSSGTVGHPVRLEGFRNAHPLFTCWEPEIFPGLVYRMMGGRGTVLVFANGRFIITGVKSRELMWDTYDKILPVISEYTIHK